MNVIVSKDYDPYDIDIAKIEALCNFALTESGAPLGSEVSVSFIDNDEMASLNERYRSKVGSTDVLSFECDNLDDGFPKDEASQCVILGDIVIAPDVAKSHSVEYGNSFIEEIELLCVHGILHLQGYDHIEDDEAKQMEDLQKSILNKWSVKEVSSAE